MSVVWTCECRYPKRLEEDVVSLWVVSCEPSAVATKLGSFERAEHALLTTELALKPLKPFPLNMTRRPFLPVRTSCGSSRGSVCDCGRMDIITRPPNINQAQQL